MLEKCLLQNDFDGLLFLFTTSVDFSSFVGTRLGRSVFRYSQTAYTLKLLLSFGRSDRGTIAVSVLFYAIHGRVGLLRYLCESVLIPKDVLDTVIFELESFKPVDTMIPIPDHMLPSASSPWELLDVGSSSSSSSSTAGRISGIRSNRYECLKILQQHRTYL